MTVRRDNYQLQAAQAKKRFLTYDQSELIARCRLRFDEHYLYMVFLGEPYRLDRSTGDLERLHKNEWIDGNSFSEIMTILDWLCDSKANRYISGRWVNVISLGHSFHRKLQEDAKDYDAELFEREQEKFSKACETLGAERTAGGDISYAVELLDGLRVLVQLWFGDEEFPAKLHCLWDENTTRYIRYETTWYAISLLIARIKEIMAEI